MAPSQIGGKKRSQSIRLSHSFKTQRTSAEREALEKQDRGFEHRLNCLWRPPTLAENANLVTNLVAEATNGNHEDDGGLGGDGNAKENADSMSAYGDQSSDGFVDDGDGDTWDDDVTDAMNGDDEEEEDGWEDVNEEDDDQESHSLEWFTYLNGVGGSEFAKPLKYEGNLSPYTKMMVDLMRILGGHHTVDLSMCDEIMQWGRHWTDKHPRIWRNRKMHKHNNRKPLLKHLAKVFGVEDSLPIEKTVLLSRGKKVTVATNDFRAQVLKLVTDPTLMKPENYIQENFDANTLRPTKHYRDYEDDDIIDDINAGSLYHEGIEKFCNIPPPPGVDMVVPLPLIFSVDECKTDLHGSLNVDRISFSLGIFNNRLRQKKRSWVDLGMVPNLHLGEGRRADNYDDKWEKTSKKQRKKKNMKKDLRTPTEKESDTQAVYRCVLESLVDNVKNEGGVRAIINGKKCLLKPFVLASLGDAKGQHALACKTKNMGNLGKNKQRRIFKDCLCNCEQLASTTFSCEFITMRHINRALEDEKYAQSIGYCGVQSAWNELPLANVEQGISGSTPYDPLHVFGLGTYEDGIAALHDFLGKNDAGASSKDALDKLCQNIIVELICNAEKRFPRLVNRFGITDLTRVTAMEKMGNVLALLVALLTSSGTELFENAWKDNPDFQNLTVLDVVRTLELILAYDAWCASPKQKWELDNAEAAVTILMERIIEYLPREFVKKDPNSNVKGSNGHHKVKFHALQWFLHYMRKLGSSINFDTSTCEEQHKVRVTRPGKQTQRRHNNFVGQVLQRNSERDVVDMVCMLISDELTPMNRNYYVHDTVDTNSIKGSLDISSTDEEEIVPMGQYTLWSKECDHNNKTNRNQVSDFALCWNAQSKNRGQISIHAGIRQGLIGWARHIKYKGTYKVTGYTSVTVKERNGNITYRATEFIHNKKRYDWALVRDPKTGSHFIGQMFGFFRYATPGFPTYKLVNIDKLEVDEIKERGLIDDTLYVALWGSATYIEEETLLQHIATRFEMEKKAPVYVLPASTIVRPLAVVPEFGAKHSTSFINVLPKKDWSRIFKSLIEELMKKRDVRRKTQ